MIDPEVLHVVLPFVFFYFREDPKKTEIHITNDFLINADVKKTSEDQEHEHRL